MKFTIKLAAVAWLALPLAPCFADNDPDITAIFAAMTPQNHPLDSLKTLLSTAHAQFTLGQSYHEGSGAARDDAEAVKWYRMAAEPGLARAQLNLGLMYDVGQGVTQDHVEAVKWYRMAAEQGLAEAQLNLGKKYEIGEGVTRNYIEALKWIREGAEQGYAPAQMTLGCKYREGRGLKQDNVEAYIWISLAAAKDYPIGVLLNLIEGEMTPDQIAEAQKRAAAWKPTAN